MAKQQKQRTDADRRVRQCERLGRLLRMLHLITGKGRWDANGLAEELECSRRTVYRLLQTLSMAGVPWYFDKTCGAYRVRPGFKFPIIESSNQSQSVVEPPPCELTLLTAKLIAEGEAFVGTLQAFLDEVKRSNLGSVLP
ncbi:MAG: helix-turn-helix transcriptional regulator [Planctomycetaceae bacterium]